MRSLRFLTLAALLMAGTMGFAKTEKTKKNPGAHDPFVMEKTAGKVYVFGVSQKLGGDEVYITEISEVDSLMPQKKTGFLPFRSSLSIQLQSYTEGVLEDTNQTVGIFFDTNKKKLEQTLAKVRKRYLSHGKKTVTTVILDEFRFKHPLDMKSVQAAKEDIEE